MAVALVGASPLTAGTTGVYTPKPGTPERKAVLDSIRSDNIFKFKVKTLRVFHGKASSIAYVHAEGPVGFGHNILTRAGKEPWVSIWGDGDGGSDSCANGVRHYAWAIKRIRSVGITPEALFPGVSKRYREIVHEAQVSPGTHCVGDLDGGPGRSD
jgi:hypothetical protein